MKEFSYDRNKAVAYARKWALSRNPKYYNFDMIGGDCTNFISQCIYAGSGVMNYAKESGWYYIDGNRKSPSWTGVEFLYYFLINNNGIGPYGEKETQNAIELGDIVQMSFEGQYFAHSMMVVNKNGNDLSGIRIASHTFDSFNKSIMEYEFKEIRFIHIKGVRK